MDVMTGIPPMDWDEYEARIGANPGYDMMDSRSMRELGEHELADRWDAIAAERAGEEPVTATDVDAVAPPSWSDFIGQAAAVDELEVRALSARKRDAPMRPTLLMGPPGTGKTTLSTLVANELDRPLVVLSKPPRSTDALIDALWPASRGVVLLDEIHLWGKGRQQHDLMDLLEAGEIQGSSFRQGFPALSVIAATTERGAIGPALLSRFECQPAWHPYTEHEMVMIVRGMATRAGLPEHLVTPELAIAIANAAAGTPRSARAMVLAGRDLFEAGREVTGASVLTFCQIESDGMTLDHLAYLGKLAASMGGKAGLAALTTHLRVQSAQLRQTEQLLLDRGFVALTPGGRQITPAGRDRLMNGAR